MSDKEFLTFNDVEPTENIVRKNLQGKEDGRLSNNIDNLSNDFLQLSILVNNSKFGLSRLARPEIIIERGRNEAGYKKTFALAKQGLQQIIMVGDKNINSDKKRKFPSVEAKRVLTESYNMLDPKNERGAFYRKELQEFSKELDLGELKDLSKFRSSSGREIQ